MMHDLRKQTNKTKNIDTQVCIVGAGAAGITLALMFERLGVNAILLEGGGLGIPQADELDLYDAKVADKPYPLVASRLRYFGGSTNHWGGWSRALDDFDFAVKPYYPIKGWPIKSQEMHKFYPEAAKICEIPNFSKSHDGYYDKNFNEGVLKWEDSLFTNKFFVFSPPTRFGSRYLPDVESSKYVTTYLHANATDLIYEQDKIIGVTARSLNGNILNVSAEQIILAMGGLENPRFMLNSRTALFDKGVGNHSDWLGRCFMDHPGFEPIDLLLPEDLNYKMFTFEENTVMPVISMNMEELLRQELNNFCFTLERKKDDAVISGQYAENTWINNKEKKYGNYIAQFIFEPSPCKDSRVTLMDDLDSLGKKKLKLDWQFNDRDFRSLEKVINLMIRELGVKGLGRIKWRRKFNPKTIRAINGGMHHAGTTKMSTQPEDGVVDENCKVHASQGLYVVGNSVFPHVGFSNPTITIVSLAIRLAKHIKGLNNE